jgi:hypothetical protein
LRGGSVVDVSHPCNNSIPRWREAGLLQPIDTSRLSNWPDVFDSLKTFEGAQDGDKQYFVPVDWGNTSIIYGPIIDMPSGRCCGMGATPARYPSPTRRKKRFKYAVLINAADR